MGDGSLSQDEIDALLQGADDMLSPAGGPVSSMDSGSSGGTFSSAEQGRIRDALNSAAMSVAPSLSGYLGGRNLSISNARIEIKSPDAVRADFPAQYVQISMDYSGSINGRNLIVFSMTDAGSISALMMGDESGRAPAELSEAYQSTIQEFTNQLLSSMATQFSSRVGGPVNTSPANLSLVNRSTDLQLPMGNEIVKISYDLSINGVINSKLYHLMDVNLASSFSRGSGSQGGGASHQQQQQQYSQQQSGHVGISPVKFPPLDSGSMLPGQQMGNISLLLDVEMTLTVELGRTKQLVQDILGLGEGSIIELDKLAGEPVDLLVNGKLIAKGEVVVIDENFGVRVTDIVSPADRLSGLQ